LHGAVSRLRPLTIHTAGLGVFMSPAPVLYIPVVRAPTLERVHRLVWRNFPLKEGDGGYYAPAQWVPHITLAVGDLTSANLPDVIAFLAGRDFHWEIRLDSLSLVVDVAGKYEIQCGCRFEGGQRAKK
jgi:2'-5' RNA ligase